MKCNTSTSSIFNAFTPAGFLVMQAARPNQDYHSKKFLTKETDMPVEQLFLLSNYHISISGSFMQIGLNSLL